MTISNAFELATNAEFKELSNFSLPPRAGRVTAIEPSGQVRVASDDPDGGDVLAWPLNGFTYAVDDVVYMMFPSNSPDSAIVLGALAPLPALEVGDPLAVNTVRARSGAGLRLEEDGGNLGLFIQDGTGNVGAGVNNNTAAERIKAGGLAHTVIIAEGSFSGRYRLAATGAASGGRNFEFTSRDGTLQISSLDDGWGSYLQQYLLVALPGGNMGFGVVSPQGRLHAHDGTGGLIFVTKTGITNVSQTIIPNGSGDVTGGLAALLVAKDGSGATITTLLMSLATNSDVVVGGLTLRFTLAASGALTVIRQAGVGTASLALLAVWL